VDETIAQHLLLLLNCSFFKVIKRVISTRMVCLESCKISLGVRVGGYQGLRKGLFFPWTTYVVVGVQSSLVGHDESARMFKPSYFQMY